ncbi:hypothetical protein NHQ30_001533 [Ciborinia camelliae]|nr:hypothetical protein NHQ30_001533 [Ciborinia camelliae]
MKRSVGNEIPKRARSGGTISNGNRNEYVGDQVPNSGVSLLGRRSGAAGQPSSLKMKRTMRCAAGNALSRNTWLFNFRRSERITQAQGCWFPQTYDQASDGLIRRPWRPSQCQCRPCTVGPFQTGILGDLGKNPLEKQPDFSQRCRMD